MLVTILFLMRDRIARQVERTMTKYVYKKNRRRRAEGAALAAERGRHRRSEPFGGLDGYGAGNGAPKTGEATLEKARGLV